MTCRDGLGGGIVSFGTGLSVADADRQLASVRAYSHFSDLRNTNQ